VRRSDVVDRSNTKTTLLATVCDSRDLQPHLPQVILPRYTQHAMPPGHILDACGATGDPLEYWHGTGGFATVALIKRWATRIRSVVHSFNPDAWILLIWDCSHVHLSLDVVRHMRRLGILIIPIPAKLTWLLQICDVCVFKELKTRIRMEKSSIRCRDPEGRLRVGAWISSCGAAIRDVLVQRCWEDAFDRMGLGASGDAITGRVRRAVDPAEVEPRLPSRADFATMINRANDTDALRTLHSLLVGHFMAVQAMPPGTLPPRGALRPLPHIAPAVRRRRPSEPSGMPWAEELEAELDRLAGDHHRRPHGRTAAVQSAAAPPDGE
jgi:hypothetical protein